MTANQVLAPDQLAALDLKAGWPAADVGQAVAIELNQSGGNTSEVGWNDNGSTVADTTGVTPPPSGTAWDSYDVGEFQVDSVHSPAGTAVFQPGWVASMESPLANAQEALALFKADGWQPWNGDLSFGAAHTNLATGQAAASAANAATPAQLASWTQPFPGGKWDPLNAPTEAAGAVAGTAVKAASSGLAGSIKGIAFTAIAAIAGIGLVVMGIHSASGQKPQGHGVAHAAELAAVA